MQLIQVMRQTLLKALVTEMHLGVKAIEQQDNDWNFIWSRQY